MYTTSFIIEKIGVTGAYKVLYCIMNDDITDNTKKTVFQIINYYDSYINESLTDLNNDRVINTLLELEYNESSIINNIVNLINKEESLQWLIKKQVIKDPLINHLNTT